MLLTYDCLITNRNCLPFASTWFIVIFLDVCFAFAYVFLCLFSFSVMYTLLPIYLDCPLLIPPLDCPLLIPTSFFTNIYCKQHVKDSSIVLNQFTFKLYIYIYIYTQLYNHIQTKIHNKHIKVSRLITKQCVRQIGFSAMTSQMSDETL